MARAISSIDVARRAGVSQSAVSRAFSPGAVISAATRAKVRAAADELGYRPNALARSLISGRSRMVALVTGEIDNPFYARSTAFISRRLAARGYHVLLFGVAGDEAADAAVADVLSYRVDGVLLASAALSAEMADECARLGAPVVLYNRYARGPGVSSVRVENEAGGRRVADFLVDGGHRRLGFIAGTRVDETTGDRERGFAGRVAEHGAGPVAPAPGDYTFDGGAAAMTALWREARPDAVFAASDLMALGAIDAARALGLAVPGDVSIVGFDDLPMSAWPSYALTTIRQPVERMAEAAVDLLLDKIDAGEGAAARTLLMPGELVVRGSART